MAVFQRFWHWVYCSAGPSNAREPIEVEGNVFAKGTVVAGFLLGVEWALSALRAGRKRRE
jgi:hypothetical protein